MIAALMQFLAFHRGKDHAISADALLDLMRGAGYDIPGLPSLRGLIHDARQAGKLIASGQHGYFLPADLNEAKEYITLQFLVPLQDERMTARVQLRAALEEFGGQLRML